MGSTDPAESVRLLLVTAPGPGLLQEQAIAQECDEPMQGRNSEAATSRLSGLSARRRPSRTCSPRWLNSDDVWRTAPTLALAALMVVAVVLMIREQVSSNIGVFRSTFRPVGTHAEVSNTGSVSELLNASLALFASQGCASCCGEAKNCAMAYKDSAQGSCCQQSPPMCCPQNATCFHNACKLKLAHADPIGGAPGLAEPPAAIVGNGSEGALGNDSSKDASSLPNASTSCLKCCTTGNCSHAYRGAALGSCCYDGGPYRCCPFYAKCMKYGCARFTQPMQRPLSGKFDNSSSSTSTATTSTTTTLGSTTTGGELIMADR